MGLTPGPATGYSVDQWLSGSVPAGGAAPKGLAAGKSVSDWLGQTKVQAATSDNSPLAKAKTFSGNLGADLRDFADMFAGAPAQAVKAAVEDAVEAYKHNPKAGFQIGQELSNNKYFAPWLHPLKSFQEGALHENAKPSELNHLLGKVFGEAAKVAEKGGKKAGLNKYEVSNLLDTVMAGLGLTGLHGFAKFGTTILDRVSAAKEVPPTPVEALPEAPTEPPVAVRNEPSDLKGWLDQQHAAQAQTAMSQHAQDILDGKIPQGKAEAAMRKSPALVQEMQKVAARRGEARAAFGQPPAEPEAVVKTRLAEAQDIGKPLPPADHPKVEVPGEPSTLDSAVEKVRTGRRFAMTSEERIAWNAAQRAKGQIEQPSWYRTKKIGGKQFGGFDPEEAGKMLGRGVAVAGLALGRLMQDEPYTSKTLERLPQGKASFTVDQVEQQLKRADVKAPERDAFQTILKLYGKAGKISAADLVKGFQLATDRFKLTSEDHPTSSVAGYGLRNIGRKNLVEPEGMDEWTMEDEEGEEGWTPPTPPEPPTVTTYRLPEGANIGKDSHGGVLHELNDPDMLGWTRSFVENGKRHVVEMQLNSNLAKPRESEELKWTYADLRRAQERTADAEKDLARAEEIKDKWAIHYAQEKVDVAREKVDKLQSAINTHLSRTQPYAKNFEQRIVQEELARAQGAPVRFATPDTVAKVEGWPEMYSPETRVDKEEFVKYRVAEFRRENAKDPRLDEKARTAAANWKKAAEQGHYFKDAGNAGLYVKYAEDVSPYLKSLGGKEVTDEQGHSWIEVPTQAGAKARMYGKVSPELLKALGIAAGGALTLHYLDPEDKWKAYATGAALALTGAWLAPRIIDGLKTDTRLRIDKYADDFEATKNLAAVRLHGLVQGIRKAVPDADRRVAISHWLEDQKVPLKPDELKVAKSAQAFFANAATELQKQGLLKEARDNYVTHMWDHRANQQRFGGALRTTTPFTKARTFTTLEEGKAAGLTPATEDISEIVQRYGDSVNNAMAGKRFVETLKGLQTPDGKPLIAKADAAPKGYVPVDLPQFRGSLVHPDIAPSLRMFESPNLGVPFQQVSEAMQALKRVKVVGSLFHVKTLAEVTIGGRQFSKILSTPGRLATFALGRDAMLKDLNAGGLAPDVKRLIEGGTTFTLERSTPSVEDIGGSFYQGMDELQKWLDQNMSLLGKVNKAFTEVNHKLDTLTWARVQTGIKLLVGTEAMHRLDRNGVPPEESARIASSYVNSLWGGLNWRRIAEGARSRLGRDVAMAMLHPRARSVTQILLFAPDWTVSTIRQITQAIKRPGGPLAQARGLIKPTELADLHRLALIRSAVYYLTVGNAVNLAFSGHNIWQNKNPLRIDLGDGRTMQFSKHLTEPLEWLQQPAKTAAGKLSYAVTEPINQLTGKEYIGGPPMQESRVVHAAKGLLPFPATAGSPERALAGMAGFPIYGHTAEEKRSIAFERYLREHSARAYRKRYKKRMQELGE